VCLLVVLVILNITSSFNYNAGHLDKDVKLGQWNLGSEQFKRLLKTFSVFFFDCDCNALWQFCLIAPVTHTITYLLTTL